MSEIVLLQKIEVARKQAMDGDFLTEEELDQEIDGWAWQLFIQKSPNRI